MAHICMFQKYDPRLLYKVEVVSVTYKLAL
jgi:hypothetical protein